VRSVGEASLPNINKIRITFRLNNIEKDSGRKVLNLFVYNGVADPILVAGNWRLVAVYKNADRRPRHWHLVTGIWHLYKLRRRPETCHLPLSICN